MWLFNSFKLNGVNFFFFFGLWSVLNLSVSLSFSLSSLLLSHLSPPPPPPPSTPPPPPPPITTTKPKSKKQKTNQKNNLWVTHFTHWQPKWRWWPPPQAPTPTSLLNQDSLSHRHIDAFSIRAPRSLPFLLLFPFNWFFHTFTPLSFSFFFFIISSSPSLMISLSTSSTTPTKKLWY